MKIKKKLSILLGTLLLVSMIASTAVAQPVAPKEVANPGKKIVQVNNPEAYAKQMGIIAPSSNAKIVGITMVIDGSSSTDLSAAKPVPNISSGVSPQSILGYYYLYNVSTNGNSCGIQKLRDSYYYGPSTATMTVSADVSSTWSANVGVTSGVVSAGVGFSVTSTCGVSDAYGISVPEGKTYEVIAYPVFTNKSYSVMWHPTIGYESNAGSGNAAKAVGVCFVQYSV